MSKYFFLAVIGVFFLGCTSSARIETNDGKIETNNKNAVAVNAPANTAIVSLVNQPTLNAAPSSSPNGNVTLQNFAVSKDNDIRNRKDKLGVKGGAPEPIAPNLKPAEIDAPDNSEITNGMNAKGQPLETRTFKNHPVLMKVERVDLNSRDIKVYLKNGKVVVLPEELANNFLTAPASDILKAVGIK